MAWSKSAKMKHSSNYNDAYILRPRATQIERKVLIKAMVKANEEQGIKNATVNNGAPYLQKQQHILETQQKIIGTQCNIMETQHNFHFLKSQHSICKTQHKILEINAEFMLLYNV